MLAFTTYPRQHILLARWNKQCRLSGCHLGTKLPCSLQPDGQKLHLQTHTQTQREKTCSERWVRSQSDAGNVFWLIMWHLFLAMCDCDFLPKFDKLILSIRLSSNSENNTYMSMFSSEINFISSRGSNTLTIFFIVMHNENTQKETDLVFILSLVKPGVISQLNLADPTFG